jgi:hypothetical protein
MTSKKRTAEDELAGFKEFPHNHPDQARRQQRNDK